VVSFVSELVGSVLPEDVVDEVGVVDAVGLLAAAIKFETCITFCLLVLRGRRMSLVQIRRASALNWHAGHAVIGDRLA